MTGLEYAVILAGAAAISSTMLKIVAWLDGEK